MRFGGFQIGGSYMQNTNGLDDNEIDQSAAGPGNFENWYAIAANFDRKFGNFRIGIAGSYLSMDGGARTSGAPTKDAEGYGLGLLLETGPFRIAAGLSVVDDWETTPGVTSNDGSSFDIGARYTAGSNSFGIAWFHGETEATIATSGDDEVDILWITHKLVLGPGVSWQNTLEYGDWDGEGTAATADNDGWGVATALALNF